MAGNVSYYVGTLDQSGAILAVAGPFTVAREAIDARIPLVGEAEKYSIPLIVHRPPREVRMVTLAQLQAYLARVNRLERRRKPVRP